MTQRDLPRAGETWERVRDGRRVETGHPWSRNGRTRVRLYWRTEEGGRLGVSTRRVDTRFLREFRRVEP